MRSLRMVVAAVGGLALVVTGTAAAAAPNHSRESGRQVAQMRVATARFHNIATAESAGYVPFTDVNGISCIAETGMGGMGVHLVNPALIADPAIDAGKPEALVYAPSSDGTLHLAALEYLVDKTAWHVKHAGAPQLFRLANFDETAAPNRFGLASFYSQHVWVWQHNPAGLLAMWNPQVNCRLA